mmetsp:Transcript_34030/g.95793  ORF Transcript_34030/g.95793 Transcript_34030/m.95793 type:complete len:246 (-) Transcript_34030:161-898(-)|eukprot:CAMPEP_0119121058 /NCGR_PEP_ID=MMETSP1310-20130426/1849_1 /TAXON_ID=464262 /ORGANISM="Genus nov. species nov., Strain RCC2339" /LENGTH=245 /DNA_ID=CAMNT_0007110593 /DNA_START=276 /DNA_END=1013 /DNA_ORIENTATION=-
MAMNYWESSHRQKWIAERRDVLNHGIHQDSKLKLELVESSLGMRRLSRKLCLPERCVYTAQVLFRRYWYCAKLPDALKKLNMVGPATLYLACKIEECMPHLSHHGRIFVAALTALEGRLIMTEKDLFDMEIKVLGVLQFNLVVFHGEIPLNRYLEDAKLQKLSDTARRVLSDSYLMNVWLYTDPHIIALACLVIAFGTGSPSNNQKAVFSKWLSELEVDQIQIWEAAADMTEEYRTVLERLPTPP